MIDYLELALTYGGFTSLDKAYLTHKLKHLSEEDKLAFITPPPSVINAYFAEYYQKQGPKAATDYFFSLSSALKLYTSSPSFAEEKPFIRLNLSGKSYGFAYESDKELARVFSEEPELVIPQLLFELAQLFPHYMVSVQAEQIKMAKLAFEDLELEDLTPDWALLSHVTKMPNQLIKISSFNQEECLDLACQYQGQAYYHFEQRQFVVYMRLESMD